MNLIVFWASVIGLVVWGIVFSRRNESSTVNTLYSHLLRGERQTMLSLFLNIKDVELKERIINQFYKYNEAEDILYLWLNTQKPRLNLSPIDMDKLISQSLDKFPSINFKVENWQHGCVTLSDSELLKKAIFIVLENVDRFCKPYPFCLINLEIIKGLNLKFPFPYYLKLCFFDNGEGVPASKLSLLGTPFLTLHSSSGVGIGLALLKRIMKRLSGRVTFSSYHGLKVTLFLPLIDPRANNTLCPYVFFVNIIAEMKRKYVSSDRRR